MLQQQVTTKQNLVRTTEIDVKTFKDIRNIVESHYPTQGSSVEYPKYKEMDMNNLVKDAIGDIPEDDGPHTSVISNTPNFTTVANPENVINQSSSKGNREFAATVASRKSGKPFTSFRKKPMRYGVEDLSGAVASVAMGEAKEEDQGEYDYEGDMAKSQLRSIVYNANMLHDMLEDDTNLPEWVQSKITLAEDYIVTAAQYMQSQMSEAVTHPDEKEDKILIKKIVKKMLKVKEAYLDEQDELTELKSKTLRSYRFKANIAAPTTRAPGRERAGEILKKRKDASLAKKATKAFSSKDRLDARTKDVHPYGSDD
jgi:hypothetical protein